MNKILNGIKLAFSFLTIIPLKSNFTEENIYYSLYGYPIVGLFIGILMYLSSVVLLNPLNNYIFFLPILILLVENIITNFLHIDGFCDCIDALYFTKKGKDKLKILKDPHIGTYAVVWLILFILIKLTGYYYLIINGNSFMLLLIPIAGYIAVPFQIVYMKPMFENGLGKSLKESAHKNHFIFSTVFFIVVSILFISLIKILVALLVIYLLLNFLNKYFHKTFSGYNGDTLGFSIEMVKLVFMIILIF